MRTLVALMIAGMVVTAGAGAVAKAAGQDRPYFSPRERYEHSDLSRMEKRLVEAMEIGNDGVTESALAHAVNMKLTRADRQFDVLQAKISALAVHGRTPVMRYKAYLASLAFDSPELFSIPNWSAYESPDRLFEDMSAQLQSVLLTSHDRKFVGER